VEKGSSLEGGERRRKEGWREEGMGWLSVLGAGWEGVGKRDLERRELLLVIS
jgi:hypothetical protein